MKGILETTKEVAAMILVIVLMFSALIALMLAGIYFIEESYKFGIYCLLILGSIILVLYLLATKLQVVIKEDNGKRKRRNDS